MTEQMGDLISLEKLAEELQKQKDYIDNLHVRVKEAEEGNDEYRISLLKPMLARAEQERDRLETALEKRKTLQSQKVNAPPQELRKISSRVEPSARLLTAEELGITPKMAERMRRIFEAVRTFIKEIDSHLEIVESDSVVKLPLLKYKDDNGTEIAQLSNMSVNSRDNLTDQEFEEFLRNGLRKEIEERILSHIAAWEGKFKEQKALTEIFEKITEILREFTAKQPELAALFRLESANKNIDQQLHYLRDRSQERDILKSIQSLFSQNIAHDLVRIQYLIDGYNLSDEKIHPSYALDCRKLDVAIEKMRQFINQPYHGSHVQPFLIPHPKDSPYRLFKLLDEAEVEGLIQKRRITSPDREFQDFPGMRKWVQERVEALGGWDIAQSRIAVDLRTIPAQILSTQLFPLLVLYSSPDWPENLAK